MVLAGLLRLEGRQGGLDTDAIPQPSIQEMRLANLHDDMRQRFPVLYRDCYCGCSVGGGWNGIVSKASAALAALGPVDTGDPVIDGRLAVIQVKEKFGGLRIYLNFDTEETDAIVKAAAEEAARTCEFCGNPGELYTKRGWFTTLCKECNEDGARRSPK